jgi:hypothetical protein
VKAAKWRDTSRASRWRQQHVPENAKQQVSERELCGFELRQWKELSLALRRAIAHYAQDCKHLAIVAMMLAFVAAIEQNLLRIHSASARRAWAGKPTLRHQILQVFMI